MTTKGGLPDRRPAKAVRFLPETWTGIDGKASDLHFSRSSLIEICSEAAVLGIIRCNKCERPVPIRLGNLAGKTFAEWIVEAEKTVRVQQHPRHDLLLVGAEVSDEAPSRAEVAALAAEMSALQERVAAVVPIRSQASAPSRSPAELRDDLQAAGHPVVVASELASPPAGTMMFREPGAEPVVEFPVPGEVPAADRKRGRGKTCPHRVSAGSYCRTCGRLV